MKCYSYDEENFNYQELNDVLDHLAGSDALKVGAVFWEADAVQSPASYYFSIQRMLEDMGESAYDDAGEYSENFPDMKDEEITELESIIKKYLDDKCTPNFWRVENVVKVEVTEEMILQFNSLPAYQP